MAFGFLKHVLNKTADTIGIRPEAAGGFAGFALGGIPGAYLGSQFGSRPTTGNPTFGNFQGDPSFFQQFASLLPPTGGQFQSMFPELGKTGGRALNNLFGTRAVQVADFLSSLRLQEGLIPKQAETNLKLISEIVPKQIETFKNLPMYKDLFAGAEAGLQASNQAFSDLGGLEKSLDIQGFANNGLPKDVEQSLLSSYASVADRLGTSGPSTTQGVAQAYGSGLFGLREGILQNRVNTLNTARNSAFQSLLSSQQGFGTISDLLSQSGGFDTGLGPIGFGGANSLYTGAGDYFAAGRQADRNSLLSLGGAGIGAIGSLLPLLAL